MSEPTIRTELAAAIREVNAAFNAIPESSRPKVRWGNVDDVLEEALLQPSRRRSLEAIEQWKRHWLNLFREVTK